jgi:hypothetical protein
MSKLKGLRELANLILDLPATFGIKDAAHNVKFQIDSRIGIGIGVQWKDDSFNYEGNLFEEYSVELVRIHRAGSPHIDGRYVTPDDLLKLINTSEIKDRLEKHDPYFGWLGNQDNHRAVGHQWVIDLIGC